jgi:hypothetical protein
MNAILAAATVALGLSGDPSATLTCDADALDARSYELTTRAQAFNLLRPRYRWWDAFDLGKHVDALDDLNEAATRLAERARALDPANLMAWSILSRQYLVLDEPERAEEAWGRLLRAGGTVVWSATLYDVDARTYFFLAFDRDALRVYAMDALWGGAVERGFYALPKFPAAGNERFYRALAGCLPPDARPEAVVPWRDVREIKAGNWVLWFKLDRPITVRSDRTGKRKTLDEIKVNLHGRTGELEVYKPVGEEHLALRGRGPAAFQDLARRTLVKFVDPERRMKLPPLRPGVGW